MQRPEYSYAYSASTPKYTNGHGTSSAFSASANPNEDWTKISDLAERRRIQNRIAQRNYRKKLKRRLEDLERRAASASPSPPQSHQELERGHFDMNDGSDHGSSSGADLDTEYRGLSPDPLRAGGYAMPPPQDDRHEMFAHQYARQMSTTPPPISYLNYPADQVLYASYPQHVAQNTMPLGANGGLSIYSNDLPPLPNMMSNSGMKQDAMFGQEDSMSPFSMSYAMMAGMEVPSSHTYQNAVDNVNLPRTNFS